MTIKPLTTMGNNAIRFGQWIADKMASDSWFRYSSITNKWFVYMTGHVTTEELYKIYLSEKK